MRERSYWRHGCIKKITAPPSWHRCILSKSHCTWFFALDFCTCYNLWRETKVCISQSCVSQCLPFNWDFAGLWLQFQRHLGADKARGIAWSCCHRWLDIIMIMMIISQKQQQHQQQQPFVSGVLPNLFPRPRSVGELVDWCRYLTIKRCSMIFLIRMNKLKL